MSIIDDVVINTKSTLTKVTKKAEQMIENTKLKKTENDIQNEIEKDLYELGLFVYESTIKGDMDKAKLKLKISKLNELYKEADSTRTIIAENKNKKACGTCGVFNDKEAVFCNKCGSKLADFTSDFHKIKEENVQQSTTEEYEKNIQKQKIKEDVKEELRETFAEEFKEIKKSENIKNEEIKDLDTNNTVEEETIDIAEGSKITTEENREIFSNSKSE